MIRLGMTLGIKEEKIEEYKKLHANVWPEVLENLTELNFKNYSIYLHKNTLFGYVEYHGDKDLTENTIWNSNIDIVPTYCMILPIFLNVHKTH